MSATCCVRHVQDPRLSGKNNMQCKDKFRNLCLTIIQVGPTLPYARCCLWRGCGEEQGEEKACARQLGGRGLAWGRSLLRLHAVLPLEPAN
jgi:hypothetical protein